MRCLVQRVRRAHVSVDGAVVGAIGPGICAFVGVATGDGEATAVKMAEKVWHLRVFNDESGVMQRSVAESGGSVLVVSQFTLYGDTTRGRRPSWAAAAPPDTAGPLVEALAARLRQLGATVATGRFRAHMEVELVNDGPVTLMLELPPS